MSRRGNHGSRGPKPETATVYNIYNHDRNSSKLGHTINPAANRRKTFETGNSDRLEVTHEETVKYEHRTWVENGAHKILDEAGKRSVREMHYDTSPDEAKAAIQTSHRNVLQSNSGPGPRKRGRRT